MSFLKAEKTNPHLGCMLVAYQGDATPLPGWGIRLDVTGLPPGGCKVFVKEGADPTLQGLVLVCSAALALGGSDRK